MKEMHAECGQEQTVPAMQCEKAETVRIEWRYRPQVEHTYRFDQQDDLDIEDMRVPELLQSPLTQTSDSC